MIRTFEQDGERFQMINPYQSKKFKLPSNPAFGCTVGGAADVQFNSNRVPASRAVNAVKFEERVK